MPRKQKKLRSEGSKGIQSVETGIAMLKVIARAAHPLTLTEIAQAMELQAPSAHRYLASLARAGMVDRVEENGRYGLGQDAVGIGFSALSRLNSRNMALNAMMKLNRAIDECVIVFTWTDQGPVVVGWRESSDPITFSVQLGVNLSPLQSVSGRIFLANLPDPVVDEILTREFCKTPRVRWEGEKVGRAQFERSLRRIRERGLARGKSEVIVGVNAMGAPVFGRGGEPLYALVVIGTADRMDVSWDGPTAHAVRRIAAELSVQLGHRRI